MVRNSDSSALTAPFLAPQVSGELLQVLRLLALPPEQADQLLSGAGAAEEHMGFGEPPILSAAGVDICATLAEPSRWARRRE